MNILVCIKQVPVSANVDIDEATGVLKRDGAGGKMNPYDLYALELALQLREGQGGRVEALTMGPPQARKVLEEALHMGAERGYLLCDRRFAGADVLATARALSGAIRTLPPYDIILCGKQTTDGDTAQVGPEIAELLGLEHAAYVQVVSPEEGALAAQSNMGDYLLTQRIPLPCLLTVEKDINTPRLPSYRRALAASPEQITTLTLDDLGNRDESLYGLSGSPTQVERIFPPEKNKAREIIEGSAPELAEAAYRILAEGKFIRGNHHAEAYHS